MLLSKTTVTSLRFRAGRVAVPAKMTSSIREVRKVVGACVPNTQWIASTRLDLPEPLGPTIDRDPGSKFEAGSVGERLEPDHLQCL